MKDFIQYYSENNSKGKASLFLEGSDEPLPTVTDLYGNEFTPDPNQTIQYMAALMVKNPRLLSRFVREMKRHEKGMNMMMDENFSHPEFYSHLAEGMAKPEEGRKRCHRIGRAMNDQYMTALEQFVIEQKMNEEVQPKADLRYEDGGPMGSTPQNPSGMPPKPGIGAPGVGYTPQGGGGAFGGGGPSTTPQPTAGGGAMGGGGVGNPPGATGGMGAGPDGMPSAGGMPAPGAPGTTPGAGGTGMPPGGPPGAGGPPGPGLDMGTGQKPPGAPMGKLKGETAHGNLIESLGSFPHMKNAMIEHCMNGDCKVNK